MKPQRLLSLGVASIFFPFATATSQTQNPAELEKQIRDTEALLQKIRNQGELSTGIPVSPSLANPAGSEIAPAAATPASPSPALDGPTYTVQKGDNIWSLARRFKISQEDLKKANGLDGDSPVILIGQKLKIPGASLPADTAAEPSAASAGPGAGSQPVPGTKSYVVQEGDTVAGIAFRYTVTQSEILRLNRMENPNSIRAGQILQLPGRDGAGSSTSPVAAEPPSGPPVPPQLPVDTAGSPEPSKTASSEPQPEVVQETFPVFEPYLSAQSGDETPAPEPAETGEESPAEDGSPGELETQPETITAEAPPAGPPPVEAPPAALSTEGLPETPPRPSSFDPQVGGAETVAPEHRVPGYGLYIVRKNDTVPSVAERHSLSVDVLVGLNRHLKPGSRLVPGEILRVAPGNLLLLPEDAPVPAETGATASLGS